MKKAYVKPEELSDTSVVFNVIIEGDEYTADITIGAMDQAWAHKIADAINEGASWITA